MLPTFDAFHPPGRNGQPADVALAILFLASQDASWITGTVVPVDGGDTAGRNCGTTRLNSWKDYFANLMKRVGEFGKLAPEAMRGLNMLDVACSSDTSL